MKLLRNCCPVFFVRGCRDLICLHFIFQMQENANELQYTEASEAQSPPSTKD